MKKVRSKAIAVLTVAFLCLIGWNPGNLSGNELYNHDGTMKTQEVKSKDCSACHDKSATESLIGSQEKCYSCHDPIAMAEAKEYRHIVVVDKTYPDNTCEGCHRMHKSPAKQLLIKDELELCYSCHPEQRDLKSHPVVTFTDEYGQTSEIFGRDGKVITCASHCHDIHGSDFQYLCSLEPGRDLCITCHDEFR